MRKEQFFVGIDLGGTHTKLGVLNADFNIIARRKIKTRGQRGPDVIIKDTCDNVIALLRAENIDTGNIYGIGIGLPGLMNRDTGIVHFIPQLSGWENYPLVEHMESRLSIRSFLEHDMEVIALGEMEKGAARGYRDFCLATLGTGIGVAIVIDGKLYRKTAGAMGHQTLDYKGRGCNCGSRGCLEEFVSVRSIERAAIDMTGKRMTPLEIAQAAEAGEEWALSLWRDIGCCLGFGIINVTALISPEVFIIGGDIAKAWNLFVQATIETLEKHAYAFDKPSERLIQSQLGSDAGIIGGAVLVKDKLGINHETG